ncbi:MAG: hypothetical protein K2X04_00800 [Burkholderiales bacterium]|nr:hypothetical protein [Burkholderiales bacterium]
MTFILSCILAITLIALSVMLFALVAPFLLFIAGILGLIFVVYPGIIAMRILDFLNLTRNKTKKPLRLLIPKWL